MKSQLIAIVAAVLVVGCGPPKPPDISIHEAAKKGNIEAVKQHLAAGTDVNAKDEDGYTPLYAVAGGGHKEVAELLIVKGADVNVKDGMGHTPLLIAAIAGHKEVAKLLIAEGTDVNAKDKTGWTLLQHAVMMSKREIVALLITEGADVNAKVAPSDRFFKGKTPLDLASEAEIADLLRKHGGKHGTIHVAARGGDIEAVKEFLATGTDVNAKDDRGVTPLDWANGKETADLLRKHGGKTGEELKAEGK